MTEEYFNPNIPGLESLLFQADKNIEGNKKGFRYYPESGLNIVAYGQPGVGKTIFALQTAVSAALQGWHVIYLTKDTPDTVLAKRIIQSFSFFRPASETIAPGALSGTDRFHDFPIGNRFLRLIFLENLCSHAMKSLMPAPQETHPDASQSAVHFGLNDLAPAFKDAFYKNDGFLAFAGFNESAFAMSGMDRYSICHAAFPALGLLRPSLRPVFDFLENHLNESAQHKLCLIFDSMSAPMLEHHLQAQPHRRSEPLGRVHTGGAHPVFLFVLESFTLPEAMRVAFPPDVQICMEFRQDAHGVRTRTIQMTKTRFQKSLDEATAFHILGAQDIAALSKEIRISPQPVSAAPSSGAQLFAQKHPGIEIFAPLSHEATGLRRTIHGRTGCNLKFLIEGLDNTTAENNLSGGGCTLLATQYRSGSTALSLYYLLAQIGEYSEPIVNRSIEPLDLATFRTGKAAPKSVLLIKFSGDIEDTLHTIWQHPALRKAIWKDDLGKTRKQEWDQWRKEILAHVDSGQHRHCLYKIPLRHFPQKNGLCKGTCPQAGPFLYIYVPNFAWITVEEAMERIACMLGFQHPLDPQCAAQHLQDSKEACNCLEIDRVVVDRVGQISSRWPLVANFEVLISGVIALASRHQVDILLVDDTAEKGSPGAFYTSPWTGVAQNIIRLRRIPFHGTEATTLDLLKAGGRLIVAGRPRELVFSNEGSPDNYDSTIMIEDNFRGYTGVSIGKPERCRIVVELSYDAKRTPLYRDVYSTQQSLHSAMDAVEVKLLGPSEWSGINSGFNNLSSVTRDTCHIVAIDGIWLGSLMENEPRVLHQFTDEEFHKFRPAHFGQSEYADMYWQYTTRSLTTSIAEIARKRTAQAVSKLDGGLHYAIPMRHNWGVLSIAKLSPQFMKQLFISLLFNWNSSTDPEPQPRKARPPRANARPAPAALTATNPAICLPAVSIAEIQNRLVALLKANHESLEDSAIEHICSAMTRLLFPDPPSNPFTYCETIRAKVNREANSHWITWRNIADFRTDIWHPFWKGNWFDQAMSECAKRKPALMDLWLSFFPRIDLFGIAEASEESIVSFFLELLLTQANLSRITEEVAHGYERDLPKQGGKLKAKVRLFRFFVNPAEQNLSAKQATFAKTQFTDTLVLFMRLLSPRQRRRLGIGLRTASTEIGALQPNRYQMLSSHYGETMFADWPSQINLLTRDWITTVQDLLPRYDFRESIQMFPLPGGPETKSFWQHLMLDGKGQSASPRRGPHNLEDVRSEWGIPVAGTWYLGILQGGNTDLGVDIMKEILSKDHEWQRLLDHCGAPVSSYFYQPDMLGTECDNAAGYAPDAPVRHSLPYANIMGQVYPHSEGAKLARNTKLASAAKKGKAIEPVFPFYRTQLCNYMEISGILYDLIRAVMRMQVDETALMSHRIKPNDNIHASVNTHVENAFKRISDVYFISDRKAMKEQTHKKA